MSNLPGVYINLQNGNIGGTVASNDGLAGLTCTGKSVAGIIALNEPKQLFSIEDAEAMGIDEDNNPFAHRQISDFYAQAGKGSELWVCLKDETSTIAEMVSDDILFTANGKIVLWGVVKENLSAGADGGLNDDLNQARLDMQTIANTYAEKNQDFMGFIGTSDFNDFSALQDFSTATTANVGLLNFSTSVGDKNAAMGFFLGWLAKRTVEQSIAILDEELPYSDICFTNGTLIDDNSDKFSLLHTRRYITGFLHNNREGYYFMDDLNTTSVTDDFSDIARVRVKNKLKRVLDFVATAFLHNKVAIDTDTGELQAGVTIYYKNTLETAVQNAMIVGGKDEISGVAVYVNPSQNILSTNDLNIEASFVFVGKAKRIKISLGAASELS